MRIVMVLLVSLLTITLFAGCGAGSDDPSSTSSLVSSGETVSGSGTTLPEGSLGALTDLGDLNGPTGLNWLYARATAINDAEEVVGTSLSSPTAFIWDPSTGLMSSLGRHYDVVNDTYDYYDDYYDLTPGPGAKPFIWSEAVDVNNNGWAIGNSNTGTQDADGNYVEQRAFLSDGVTFIDIAPITESIINSGNYDTVKKYSETVDINDNGYVLLNVDDALTGGRHAYFWDGVSMATAAAPNGSDVPALEVAGMKFGETSEAVALNEKNEAVINSDTTAIYFNLETGFGQVLNAILGDEASVATDINDSAQIVGTSGKLGFFWEAGAMTRIDSLGGDICNPVAINNNGQVVGSAKTEDGSTHAFLWKIGSGGIPVMKDLGTLGGEDSHAVAINENGIVVGYSDTGAVLTDATGSYKVQHAFLWANGTMYDLGVHNDFYDYEFIDSYPFSEAVGVNANGTVAGNSFSVNSNYRAFILTPTFP